MIPFSNDFRNRIFNWVRAYKDYSRYDVSPTYLIMRLLERMHGKAEAKTPSDLPPIDEKDADFMDECFREFSRLFKADARLIVLCWFKDYRPSIIKRKTGIFVSDQEVQLLIAEKKFERMVKRTEEIALEQEEEKKRRLAIWQTRR